MNFFKFLSYIYVNVNNKWSEITMEPRKEWFFMYKSIGSNSSRVIWYILKA